MISFENWCNENNEVVNGHNLKILSSSNDALMEGCANVAALLPKHYASPEHIVRIFEKLGKDATAEFLRARLPRSSKIRSGDLGEILATEYIDECTIYNAPIKRLRWKDHREMAMRGDDVIGVAGPEDDERIGTSGFEEDALKSRDIVVATPEKLDFALRNDPRLIDDVGLIVLDEGHMIGLGEREVRYEVQIQRLLKWPDADQRRIVCLSAILPEGDEFDDFVSWLRRDQPGGAVTANWRPTRVRFGEVLWRGDRGRLDIRVDDEKTFVPGFLFAKASTKGKRKKLFPKDQRELVLATAWRLVEDGQSVLIYCPQRRSVEPIAEVIVDLHARGLLETVLDADPNALGTALTIGTEWLGERHPTLACLRLGVAIHHGALPTPFRKEMERLLREGVLKITVSSPTLAQGLNLAATAVVFFSLDRFDTSTGRMDKIPASEFKNVIGRAGRAFIDVEGLVLYPIYNNHDYRRAQWRGLVDAAGTLSMESGLLRLLATLLQRLAIALGKPTLEELLEYVMNNAAAWQFPEIRGEKDTDREREQRNWATHIATLDTAILGILGEQECEEPEIAERLDDLLASSLWSRRLSRCKENVRTVLKGALEARAKRIWAASTSEQRKGYFLAGVGLDTGHQLDAIAAEANDLLVQANAAILMQEDETAIEALTGLAERLFGIPPFVPNPFPDNWRTVLRRWLEGSPIGGVEEGNMFDVLRFVEGGLIYRLPWGMEAVRVRAQANNDVIGDFSIDDFELGLAVAAMETGTLNRPAALLMQAGFTSRLAAIKAVRDSEAEFSTARELADWLQSDRVTALLEDENWPTSESASLWRSFVLSYALPGKQVWSKRSGSRAVRWYGEAAVAGSVLKIHHTGAATLVLSPTYVVLGHLAAPFAQSPAGLVTGRAGPESRAIVITYYGPDDLDLDS